MRSSRLLISLFSMSLGALACPFTAAAQPAPQAPVRLTVEDPFKGIKHQFSLALSGGFDLDVLGNVVNGAVGGTDRSQLAIRTAIPFPDIYVSVPKRPELTVGFGLRQKDEVLARFSRASYASQPLVNAGNFVDADGDRIMALDVSTYKERSWEVGWRHYMVMTRRAKQYANIVYGNRTIEPIEAVLSVAGESSPLGTFRLYDRSTVKTFGLELGLTVEQAHTGAFVQVGARFQRRLERNDEDLSTLGLEVANNTGVRFYMPLQFGVLLRM